MEKTQYSYKKLDQNCHTTIHNTTRRGNNKNKEGKPEKGTNDRHKYRKHNYENARNIKRKDIKIMKAE